MPQPRRGSRAVLSGVRTIGSKAERQATRAAKTSREVKVLKPLATAEVNVLGDRLNRPPRHRQMETARWHDGTTKVCEETRVYKTLRRSGKRRGARGKGQIATSVKGGWEIAEGPGLPKSDSAGRVRRTVSNASPSRSGRRSPTCGARHPVCGSEAAEYGAIGSRARRKRSRTLGPLRHLHRGEAWQCGQS